MLVTNHRFFLKKIFLFLLPFAAAFASARELTLEKVFIANDDLVLQFQTKELVGQIRKYNQLEDSTPWKTCCLRKSKNKIIQFFKNVIILYLKKKEEATAQVRDYIDDDEIINALGQIRYCDLEVDFNYSQYQKYLEERAVEVDLLLEAISNSVWNEIWEPLSPNEEYNLAGRSYELINVLHQSKLFMDQMVRNYAVKHFFVEYKTLELRLSTSFLFEAYRDWQEHTRQGLKSADSGNGGGLVAHVSEDDGFSPLTCLQCLCEHSNDQELIYPFKCDHGYCKQGDCFDHYVDISFKDKRIFSCPLCKADPDYDYLSSSQIIDSELNAQLKFNSIRKKVYQEHTWIHCKTPSCEGGVFDYKTSGSRFTCQICTMSHCIKCPHDHSAYLTCEEYERQANYTDPLQSQKEKGLVKVCPSFFCKTPISKSDGCLHMTCPKCGYEFNWETLKKWRSSDHYYRLSNGDRINEEVDYAAERSSRVE